MTSSGFSIRPPSANNESTVERLPEGVNNFFRFVPTGCFPEALGMPTKALQWRNVLAGLPEQTFHSKPQISTKRRGRCGPLSPEARKHAQALRQLGACLHCRLSKVRVSI
jgi:hypothetical protein